MDKTLVTKGNVGTVSEWQLFWMKARQVGRKVIESPLTKVGIVVGGGCWAFDKFTKRGYSAEANWPGGGFSIKPGNKDKT